MKKKLQRIGGALAFALAVVTTVWRALGDTVLLRRYARRRAEAIDLMRWTTDGLARLFAWDDPLVRQMRNTGLALVNAAGPLKRALVRHALG